MEGLGEGKWEDDASGSDCVELENPTVNFTYLKQWEERMEGKKGVYWCGMNKHMTLYTTLVMELHYRRNCVT